MKTRLLFITLFISSFISFSQDVDFVNTWGLPSARAATSSANDGENIYLANGFSTSNLYTSEVYKRTNTAAWSVLTDLTIPKNYASTAFVNTKLYVFNGEITGGERNNQMEVIDVTTGAITLSTTNPSPSRAGGVATYNNEIYSFGGSTASGVFSNNVYKFNPITETWTFVTNMPISAEVKGEIVNGKLYVFGGYGSSGSLNGIDIYDIEANTWSTATDMPSNLSAYATAVIGDTIWLLGDYSNQEFVASFNTNTLAFLERNNNMLARRHATAEGIGEKLYIIGGNTASAISSTIQSVQVSDLTESSVLTAERNALMAIYYATNGSSWTNNTNWGSAHAESLWHGVTVEHVDGADHVTKIIFHENNLNGYLPAEIENLTELNKIDITFNDLLTGSIPTQIGNLTNLEYLSLWSNDFTGDIPSEIGNCTSIKTFSLEDNQLTGSIPTSFSALTATESFWLNGNQLTGDVPDLFSNWTNLKFFSLGSEYATTHNNFSGEIDLSNNNALIYCAVDNTEISDLNLENGNNVNMSNSYFHAKNTPNLTCIFVDETIYSATNWTNIDTTTGFVETEEACTTLHAQRPALMTIYNATNGASWTTNTNWNTANPISTWHGVTVENGFVTELSLNTNNLTGTIPIEIGNLTELENLYFFNNNLTSEIPSEIWTLSKLKHLWLGSQISSSAYEPGTLTLSSGIPTSISNLQDLEWLNLNGIFLEQPLQAELFNLPVLNRLRLQDCGITGTLPADFSTINDLRIERNEFEGTIPSEITTSTGNALLSLTGNYFNFTDLEPIVIAANIADLQYSPQRTRDVEEETVIEPGGDITFEVDTTGIDDTSTKSTTDIGFQWFKNEVVISGANDATYTITEVVASDSGAYYCELTDSLVPDLIIRSANHTLSVSGIGIDDYLHSNFIIYPNPTKDKVYIKLINKNILNISIVDINGKLILKRGSLETNESIDLSKFEAGMYIIRIQTDKGMFTSRILKK